MPKDDELFPEGWEIRFDRDLAEEIEEMGGTVATPEQAEEWGFTEDDPNYRGYFFSWEDAVEYAREIGLPCVFVADENGVHVWVDYLEVDI